MLFYWKQIVMEAAALQVTELLRVGRGLRSARCLPFKCGITEEVNSVYRTAPRGPSEEKEEYAVITDTLPGSLINVVSLSL